jgi:hypothetical protein
VLSKTRVVPARNALELDKEKFERLNEILGEGGIASILVAQEHGTLLYADDFGLSSLARNDHGVESVWTQTILFHMLESKIITEDEYHDATRKLLLANYFHTYISIDDIKWVLQRDGFSLTGDVTHIIGFLKGPGPDEDAAVDVVAELIKYVWAQTSVERQRWLFLDFALNTLMSGREIGRTMAKLKCKLKSKFLILLGLPSILQTIDAWQQQASRVRSTGL